MLTASFSYETALAFMTGGGARTACRRARVLIVEDNADLMSVLVELLTQEGFVVDPCGDGLKGVEMAERSRYDVVVSDVRLPGLNGLELARRVSNLPDAPRVILMTAYPDWHVLRDGFRRDEVFELMEKPIDLTVLVERVRAAGLAR